MRNIDDGKKWGSLPKTLRAWVQGRERLMRSIGRGCSYLLEDEGTCEFLGCFTETSPVWRSTEFPLNPSPRGKHLSCCKAQTPEKNHVLLRSPLYPLSSCVLRLPDMPFMTEITCLGTDTWNSLKVHPTVNAQINKTEAARRALPIHPPATPPFPSPFPCSIPFQGYFPSPGRRLTTAGTAHFIPTAPDIFLPVPESWVIKLGSGITHSFPLISRGLAELSHYKEVITLPDKADSHRFPIRKWNLSPLRQTCYCCKPLQPTQLKIPCKS